MLLARLEDIIIIIIISITIWGTLHIVNSRLPQKDVLYCMYPGTIIALGDFLTRRDEKTVTGVYILTAIVFRRVSHEPKAFPRHLEVPRLSFF